MLSLSRLLGRAPPAAASAPEATAGDTTTAGADDDGAATSGDDASTVAPSSNGWGILRRGIVSGTLAAQTKSKRENSGRKAAQEEGLIWDSAPSMEYGGYIPMEKLNAVWKSRVNHLPVDGVFSYLIRRGPITGLGLYFGDNVDEERPWYSRDATDTYPWYVTPRCCLPVPPRLPRAEIDH